MPPTRAVLYEEEQVMIYTLVFGAPVTNAEGHLGSLKRIILNNGVADQLSVDPSGLFSGPERVVPISDVTETSADGITLKTGHVDWQAYGAFDIQRLIVADTATGPDTHPAASSPQSLIGVDVVNRAIGAEPEDRHSTDVGAVVLTGQTRVGDHGTLTGLVADTGIPKHLLVGNDEIPFSQVGVLDDKHIQLGATLPDDDVGIGPGTIGQSPEISAISRDDTTQ
jgi:hypothetical protein